MKQNYQDIIDAVKIEPVWWQQDGVPRFCKFSPDTIPDIYAKEAALVEIACQACGTRYTVGFTCSDTDLYNQSMRMMGGEFLVGHKTNHMPKLEELEQKYADHKFTIAGRINSRNLYYGDPPNTGCCNVGPTMTSLSLRVIEYWSRNNEAYVENGVIKDYEAYRKWERNPKFEIDLPDKAYVG